MGLRYNVVYWYFIWDKRGDSQVRRHTCRKASCPLCKEMDINSPSKQNVPFAHFASDPLGCISRHRNRKDTTVAMGNTANTLNTPVATETADTSVIPNSNGNCVKEIRQHCCMGNTLFHASNLKEAFIIVPDCPFVIWLLCSHMCTPTGAAGTQWVSESMWMGEDGGKWTQKSRCGSQPSSQEASDTTSARRPTGLHGYFILTLDPQWMLYLSEAHSLSPHTQHFLHLAITFAHSQPALTNKKPSAAFPFFTRHLN